MAAMLFRTLLVALLVASGAEALAVAVGNATNPVARVISLLEGLQTQVQDEGKAEAATYETFACFCRDATSTKSGSIMTGQDQIDTLSADIQLFTATQASKAGDLADRKAQEAKLSDSLKAKHESCLKESATFEAAMADLTKAVSSLDHAVKALKASKPSLLSSRKAVGKAHAHADALRLTEAVGQTLVLAEAMSLVKPPERRVLQAFVQQGVDPTSPEYTFHSQGVIDTLERLLLEFTNNKDQTKLDWDKATTSCNSMKRSLTNQMATNDAAMNTLTDDINKLKSDVATRRGSLVQAESMLKDDQTYLKDLTERCEVRAKDWDQRSALRAGELKALSSALAILNGQVQDLDAAVNVRALLVQRGGSHGQASLGVADVVGRKGGASKVAASRASDDHGASFHGDGAARHLALVSMHRSVAMAQQRAVVSQGDSLRGGGKAHAYLVQEGARLRSPELSAIAARVAVDPFGKVKTLIQNLIERLLKESTEEATKKGFCDTEVSKAVQSRNTRYAQLKKLIADIIVLDAKRSSLVQEISELEDSANQTTITLQSATSERAVEKAQNIDTIVKAKEGLGAVNEAISILKAFYKEAAKAKSLLQASPVDVDDPGAGFQGAYVGQQEASKGIFGLLAVIKSDFERTIRTTESDEKEAAASFVDFDRTSKVNIAESLKSKELKEQEAQSVQGAINQGMVDVDNVQVMLDSALKTITDLTPMCIDTSMTYAERVAKREEEIAALRKALCYLDQERVEAECASA